MPQIDLHQVSQRLNVLRCIPPWVEAGFNFLKTEPATLADSRIGPQELHFRFKSDKQDFIDCVRSREATLEPAEVGHRVQSLCLLGHIAIQAGRPLEWDPKQERFLGNDAANQFLDKPIQNGS